MTYLLLQGTFRLVAQTARPLALAARDVTLGAPGEP
jgi:hypothetical protein